MSWERGETKLDSKNACIMVVLAWHTMEFGLFLETRSLKAFKQRSVIIRSEVERDHWSQWEESFIRGELTWEGRLPGNCSVILCFSHLACSYSAVAFVHLLL